jgi:hypothetical protein
MNSFKKSKCCFKLHLKIDRQRAPNTYTLCRISKEKKKIEIICERKLRSFRFFGEVLDVRVRVIGVRIPNTRTKMDLNLKFLWKFARSSRHLLL